MHSLFGGAFFNRGVLTLLKGDIKMDERQFTKNQQILMDYHGEIANYLSSFGLRGDELKDAVQDTYTEAFASLHRLKDETKIKHWVIVIAKRVGKKHQRKQRKRNDHESPFDETDVHLQDINLYEKDFVVELVRKEDMNELAECINTLKPKERSVLLLREIYGKPFKDVSDLVGENLNNTKSIARRAKMKIRQNLIMMTQNDLDESIGVTRRSKAGEMRRSSIMESNRSILRETRRSAVIENLNEGGLSREK